jgi:hypothetical protein
MLLSVAKFKVAVNSFHQRGQYIVLSTLGKGCVNMMDVLKVLLDLLGFVLVMGEVSVAHFLIVTRAL